jgi:hypothetical protein
MNLKETVNRKKLLEATQAHDVKSNPINPEIPPSSEYLKLQNEIENQKTILESLAQESHLSQLLEEAMALLNENHKGGDLLPGLFVEDNIADVDAYRLFTLWWQDGGNAHKIPMLIDMNGTILFYPRYKEVKKKLPLFLCTFEFVLTADPQDTMPKTAWQSNNAIIRDRLADYLLHPNNYWQGVGTKHPEDSHNSHPGKGGGYT